MYGHKSPGQALNQVALDEHLSFHDVARILDVSRDTVTKMVLDEEPFSSKAISDLAAYFSGYRASNYTTGQAEYVNARNAWTKLVHEWEQQKTVKGNKNMNTTFTDKAKINQFTTGWAVTLHSGVMDVRIPPSTVITVVYTGMTRMNLQIGDLTLSVMNAELNRVWPELFPAT